MKKTKRLLGLMAKHSSRHYGLATTCFESAKGVYVRDTEGKTYIDAVSGYGSVSLGHNHPRITELLRNMNTPDHDGWGPINVVPNVYSTPELAEFLQYACGIFGYDRALVTNGGVEAIESGLKLMRKYGHVHKGIPEDRARIVVCEGNFHGRTTTVVGFSSEPAYRVHFGPYAQKAFVTIPFGDALALKKVLEDDARSGTPTIAGFLVEPIQGEGGVRIPPSGYLKTCADLCKKHNVVFCADEIQTGLGRTGTLLASEHDDVKPDLVLLAKTLGGGKQPVAAVLGMEKFMVFESGDHGSTYGGNPQSMAVAREALNIIVDEDLCEVARKRGDWLLSLLRRKLAGNAIRKHLVKEIRGKGLMIGIELHHGVDSSAVTAHLLANGVLTKDAHGVIRITPPLIISESECIELAKRIGWSMTSMAIESDS